MDLPMAPALGLYLGELFFDGYNNKQRKEMVNDKRLAALRAEKAAKVWPPPAAVAAPAVVVEGTFSLYLFIYFCYFFRLLRGKYSVLILLLRSCFAVAVAASAEEEPNVEGDAKRVRLNPPTDSNGAETAAVAVSVVAPVVPAAVKPAPAEKEDEGQVLTAPPLSIL
jgi:hypothetical protein